MARRNSGNGEGTIRRDLDLKNFTRQMNAEAPETPEEKKERERRYRLTPLYFYFGQNYYRDPHAQEQYKTHGGVKGYLTDLVSKDYGPRWKSQGKVEELEGVVNHIDELEVPMSEEKVRGLLSLWKEQASEWYEQNEMDDWQKHIFEGEPFPKPVKDVQPEPVPMPEPVPLTEPVPSTPPVGLDTTPKGVEEVHDAPAEPIAIIEEDKTPPDDIKTEPIPALAEPVEPEPLPSTVEAVPAPEPSDKTGMDYKIFNQHSKKYLGVQLDLTWDGVKSSRQYAVNIPNSLNTESIEVQHAMRDVLAEILRENEGGPYPDLTLQESGKKIVASYKGNILFEFPVTKASQLLKSSSPELAEKIVGRYVELKTISNDNLTEETRRELQELEREIIRNPRLDLLQRTLDTEFERRWKNTELGSSDGPFEPKRANIEAGSEEVDERLKKAVQQARVAFGSNSLKISEIQTIARTNHVDSAEICRELLSGADKHQLALLKKFYHSQEIPQSPASLMLRAVETVQQQRLRGVDKKSVQPTDIIEIPEGFEGKPYGLDWSPYSGAYYLRSKLGVSAEGEERWYRIPVPSEIDVSDPNKVEQVNEVFQEMYRDNGNSLQVNVAVGGSPENPTYRMSLAGEQTFEVSVSDALDEGTNDPVAWYLKGFLSEYFEKAQAQRKENPDQPLDKNLEIGEAQFKKLLLGTREPYKQNYATRTRNRVFVNRVRRKLLNKAA